MVNYGELTKKAQILFDALNKPTRWYSGLSIKRYIQNKYFNQSHGFFNKVIDSGRWSAYCHYNLLAAFKNIFDKQNIPIDSIVIAHPFIPYEWYSYIIQKKYTVLFFDIEKSTLTFDNQKLFENIDSLKRSGKNISLIIHYNLNGLYSFTSTNIASAKNRFIPSLVYIENPTISFDLINLFEALELGGIIISDGDSFWDDHLNLYYKETKLDTKSWFISWALETRVVSLPEYHLKDSFTIYYPLLMNYLLAITDNIKKTGIKGAFFTWVLLLRLKLGKKTTQPLLSHQKPVGELYNESLNLAVPDVVFELEHQSPIMIDKQPKHLEESQLILLHSAKKIYDFFKKYIQDNPTEELEIPEFYLDKTYGTFVFYTKNIEFWSNYFQLFGVETYILRDEFLHLTDSDNMPNVRFIMHYGILVSIKSITNSQLAN